MKPLKFLMIVGAITLAAIVVHPATVIMMRKPDPQFGQRIVLIRSYVSTNLVSAGYVGSSSPPPTVDAQGWLQGGAMNADAVAHPPVWKVVTNYVLGFKEGNRMVEVFTATP